MRLGIYLVTFLLWIVCGRAQTSPAGPPVLYHITDENGLSDNHVQCVLKDHNGFVWIGTADGLNKMDGSSITIYRHAGNDTRSIGNNTIFCLGEDAAGTIWAGTATGLVKYNPGKQEFILYKPPANTDGTSGIIKSLVIDAQQRIWCGTFGGLFLFDPANAVFTSFYNTASPDIAHSNRLNYIMADSHRQLWLCTYDGVWSFSPQTHQFKKEIAAGNNPSEDGLFLCALEDHAGAIWVGGWNSGLKSLDRHTGKWTTYSPGENNVISSMVEVLRPDGHYILWLNGQLRAFDPAAGRFFQYPRPLQQAEYPDVAPAYRSKDNWIWMGSGKGLFVYNPQRQFFHHRFFNKTITSQGVNFVEWKGLLLEGAQDGDFLKAYDGQWNLKKNYSSLLHPLAPAQGVVSVLCFRKDNKDKVWVGTSAGLLRFDPATLQHKWWRHQPGDSASLPRDFVTCVLPDTGSRLWVFPWREGIWSMDTLTGKCVMRCEGFVTVGGKMKKLLVADAVTDSSGNTWMADLDEGIILYEKKTGRFSKPFEPQFGVGQGASRIFYRNGYCYTVINRKLVKWKPGINKPVVYTLPPQMDKDILDAVPDNENRWWLTTTNGLLAFDEVSGAFQRFTTADGLVSNDMKGNLYCRDNGLVLFATPEYVTEFNPAELLNTGRQVSPVLVTGIEVDGKKILHDDSLPLQLDHLSNNLVFHWTIADYTNPFHNQFYCRLEGIDADWRYVGNKGEIQYANLSPGSYKLLLKGTTANGTGPSRVAAVAFVVHAPFWKTGWFVSCCILLGMLLVYAWYRYRLRQALQLERLRTRISTDLHDDIGSTLSSISILSDIAVRESTHLPSKEMLQEIKSNSVSLMEKMDDIVWSINPKNDHLNNLLLRIKRFAAALFEAKNIDYSIEIQDDVKDILLPMEYRQHIYLIMKEAINNVVKYARAGFVSIRVGRDHSCLAVTIEDNGIGFSPSGPPTGNGILSMRHRAALMKAELKIDSAPGKGTLVSLRVKIK
jgi:ligand-binding sensor domain-containing protein/two-component sensor histidine kinase